MILFKYCWKIQILVITKFSCKAFGKSYNFPLNVQILLLPYSTSLEKLQESNSTSTFEIFCQNMYWNACLLSLRKQAIFEQLLSQKKAIFRSVLLLLTSVFLRFVHSHNRAKLNYTLELNHLSDISDSEFEMMKGQGDMDSPTIQKEINQIPQLRIKIPKEPLPKNLDWRNYGIYSLHVRQKLFCTLKTH